MKCPADSAHDSQVRTRLMMHRKVAEKPFRWNLSKREQLGRLIAGEASAAYPEFLDDLRRCCARVLALCGDSDLVFVGRSPESLFDHLSGLLSGTSWNGRCCLLNISLALWHAGRTLDERRMARHPDLRRHLTAVGLSADEMLQRPRPVAFVDLVYEGDTFARLNNVLWTWWREAHADEDALLDKLRFIGITWSKKTSPKTWRWQQHASWTRRYRAGAIRNVSIPWRLWHYLGDEQEKVASSNPPWRWGSERAARPPRGEKHQRALRRALSLYEQGMSKEARLSFCRFLTAQSALRHAWFRGLVTELRRSPK